jgi:hypothetical protein
MDRDDREVVATINFRKVLQIRRDAHAVDALEREDVDEDDAAAQIVCGNARPDPRFGGEDRSERALEPPQTGNS